LSVSRAGRFIPGERAPGTHWIGGRVGLRAVLDVAAKRKIPVPTEKRIPVVQPAAKSLYLLSYPGSQPH